MGLESWQTQGIDNVIRMLLQMEPADRAASVKRIVTACTQTPIDPGASPDMVPTNGSTVSAIRRDYTQGGRVVNSAREQDMLDAQHPHERPDPILNARPPRRLPLGERFR